MTELSRQELIALGRTIVTGRLQMLGCTVKPAGGKLDVNTPSGRSLEVFVSTQRVGGYAFWTKRRLQPAPHRFAALVLISDQEEPDFYLVPTEAWLDPAPPLTAPEYEGKKSEPEYGIEIGPSSLRLLR